MILVNLQNLKEVHPGEFYTSSKGELYRIESFEAPYTPSSTGHVYVRATEENGRVKENDFESSYFPGVFNLAFLSDEKKTFNSYTDGGYDLNELEYCQQWLNHVNQVSLLASNNIDLDRVAEIKKLTISLARSAYRNHK